MGRHYRRVRVTRAQSAELWDRWEKGERLKSIGRELGKPSSCTLSHLKPTGGIRPPARRRSRLALTLAEREEISRGLVAERSMRSIARSLGRSPSTISREIERNGGERWYRASRADQRAWDKAERPKRCKLAVHPCLRQAVERKLRHNWAPEQIAGWLKTTYPDNEAYHVSHETIYRSLFVKPADKLPRELRRSLTWDRGKELTDHKRFTLATDIEVYFCDPKSPWQWGSNENTNRLLSQYFPKRTDLSVHSQAHLNCVARELNERPRKTLDFQAPAQRFAACVASIG